MKMKKIAAVVLVLALILAVAQTSTKEAAAAAKVTKVTKTMKAASGGKSRFLIQGKTSSGSVVWTYKTSAQEQTELDSANIEVKGNDVYVIDNNKYIRLKKSSGKVVVKKKLKDKIWGACMKADDDGCLYAIGYYSSTLFKINKSGKTLWSHKFSDDCYWAYKIAFKGSKVIVVFDNGGKKSVNASTGK